MLEGSSYDSSEVDMVMKNGQLIERGQTEDIFERPQQEYTRQLIRASLTSTL